MRHRKSSITLSLSLLFILVLSSVSKGQTVDESFKNNIKTFSYLGNIKTVAVQPDNKILIGGERPSFDGLKGNALTRLNSDGSFDQAFDASTTLKSPWDLITKVLLQPDGKILVGGRFIRTSSENKTVLVGLFRLNNDGSRDEGFQANLSEFWNVKSFDIQSDGKIVVGWEQGESIGNNGYGRSKMTRLNADGSIDNTFNCGMDTNALMIQEVKVQPDGRVLAGSFAIDYTDKGILKRFNPDGSEDNLFNSGVEIIGAEIKDISLLSNGDILISGSFDTCNGVGRDDIAKLSSDGQLKNDFSSNYSESVTAIEDHVVLANGKILMIGTFLYTLAGEAKHGRFIQLNNDGSLDLNFLETSRLNGSSTGSFSDLHIDNYGKLLVVGGYVLDNVYCGLISRLNTDTSLDFSFNILPSPQSYGIVYAVAVQEDGKIIIGGNFHYVDNKRRNHVARLNFDGSLDETFTPGTGTSSGVYSILIQPDGKIVVAGNFDFFNQQKANNIVRLNADGSIDESFSYPLKDFDYFSTMAIQSDGKIILKGLSPTSNGKIIRINAEGSVDESFSCPSSYAGTGDESKDGSMFPLAIQPDGKIVTENKRFNIDGSLDSDFHPKEHTYFVALESSNKILMRGGLFGLGSEGGDGLHRINLDGSIDAIFKDVEEDEISTIFIQRNKKIITSRNPESFASSPSSSRLNSDGTIDTSFHADNIIPHSRYAIVEQTPELILTAGYPLNPYDVPYTNILGSLTRIRITPQSPQSIISPEIQPLAYNDSPLTVDLNFLASSNLEVSLEVVGGPASISDGKLVITGTGIITLRATQIGNDEYFAAEPFLQTIYVKRNQEIDFSPIEDKVYSGSALQINLLASSSSGLNVDFELASGPGAITGSTLTINEPGPVTIKGKQGGNDLFFSAPDAIQTFCIDPPKPSIAINGTTLLSSSPSNNQWFRNGILIPGATQPSIDFTEPGDYSVQVSVDKCSSDFSAGYLITDIEESKNLFLRTYPNPAKNILSVELLYIQAKDGAISLYDFSGKKVLTKKIQIKNSAFKDDLQIESLPKGAYILEIILPNISVSRKIIIE